MEKWVKDIETNSLASCDALKPRARAHLQACKLYSWFQRVLAWGTAEMSIQQVPPALGLVSSRRWPWHCSERPQLCNHAPIVVAKANQVLIHRIIEWFGVEGTL